MLLESDGSMNNIPSFIDLLISLKVISHFEFQFSTDHLALQLSVSSFQNEVCTKVTIIQVGLRMTLLVLYSLSKKDQSNITESVCVNAPLEMMNTTDDFATPRLSVIRPHLHERGA